MSNHPQLESVPDRPRRIEDQAAARRIYDLEERLAELELRIAERIERERVLTLELAAARRDLEVKSAYNVMLESAAVERQGYLSWLQSHLDHLSRDHAAELSAANQRMQAAEALGRHAESLAVELAAERARLSYRLTQAALDRISRHPQVRRVGVTISRSLLRRGGKRSGKPAG